MRTFSDEQLVLAARLYFVDGLDQSQIAKLVNVSQSKVSRMLSLARERGLVRITVPEYETRDSGLEQELNHLLTIESIVIRSPEGLGIHDLRQTVGYFAAPMAAEWMKNADRVAIGGGRTMEALVKHMKPTQPVRPTKLIQAMGNIDHNPGVHDAVELGRMLAQKWQGAFLSLNSPAMFPDAETRRRFLGIKQIQQVLTELAAADLALVGLGELSDSVFVERRILDMRDIELLRKAGAAGEILGRFFDYYGKECPTSFQKRVIGLEFEKWKKIPKRVGVVAGEEKAKAVLAAIRGGLLTTLIIDQQGASALKQEFEAGARPPKKENKPKRAR